MQVRDAVEADADSLAAIGGTPADVMRNLIHDRTVRVAERVQEETDPNADVEPLEEELLGFVSYDVRDGTVHVTQFGGTKDACETLLGEPVRFAANEGLNVEVIVEADADALREATLAAGFEKQGSGPMFEGKRTVRYHHRP
ncbi:hypothetical protein ACNS7O_06360 [Haloferacaceae archaeon DSL9]